MPVFRQSLTCVFMLQVLLLPLITHPYSEVRLWTGNIPIEATKS